MKKTILISLLIILLGIGIYSLYRVHREVQEVQVAEELSHEYDTYSPIIEEGMDYGAVYDDFMPKLMELQAINPHVVGWIYIPGTNINYPLVQGENNDYYLTHTTSKEYSVAGSVFIDAACSSECANVIIYGHNMGRASNIMFHDVTNFVDKTYFDTYTQGYIVTATGVTVLDIFAYSLTSSGTEVYSEALTPDYLRTNALNYREPATGDRLYTLSTCAYDYKEARGVLTCMGREVYNAD